MKNPDLFFNIKHLVLTFSIGAVMIGCGAKNPQVPDNVNNSNTIFNFNDTDTDMGEIAGDVTLSLPKNLDFNQQNTDRFTLYWSASKDGKKEAFGGDIAASHKELLHTFPENTKPKGKHILIFFRNTKGEQGKDEVYLTSTRIEDLFSRVKDKEDSSVGSTDNTDPNLNSNIALPAAIEGRLIIADSDPESAEIEGVVRLSNLPDVQDIDEFVLYWADEQPNAIDAGEKISLVDQVSSTPYSSGTNLHVFDENTQIGGKFLVLALKNDGGQSYSGVSLGVIDLVQPIILIGFNPEKNLEIEVDFIVPKVLFAFDEFQISSAFGDKIKESLSEFDRDREITVFILGHADERGSIQYNLALGERRAESMKRYLVALGFEASKIKTISYGELQPIDPASTEVAWAKNRRAESAAFKEKK